MTASAKEAVTGFRHLLRQNITEVCDGAAYDWIRPSSMAWRIA